MECRDQNTNGVLVTPSLSERGERLRACIRVSLVRFYEAIPNTWKRLRTTVLCLLFASAEDCMKSSKSPTRKPKQFFGVIVSWVTHPNPKLTRVLATFS